MGDGQRFWERVYEDQPAASSGRPGRLLREIASGLKPTCALELGCAKGDDGVWLARQGWEVVAVDISSAALHHAAANAQKAGVADRISFVQHDLMLSFPSGSFGLVTASFLHSPTDDFKRISVLQRAAAAVAQGGHLLIIDHGSRAPWSWSPEDTVFPTARETYASLELCREHWDPVRVEQVERMANGPDGATAAVLDNVIFLRRR